MTCHYADLGNEALLHIVGPDSLTFLQGQTTCDTRIVDSGHAVPGAYCTPQGRVVCDFLLCQLNDEHYALRMRRDIRVNSAAIFSKYIVFSKAALASDRDDWNVIGCWGPTAAHALRQVFGAAPAGRFAACSGDGFVLIQVDEAGMQFECLLDCQAQPAYLEQLQAHMQHASEAQWRSLEIAGGLARIEMPTVEEFVPQMLNYDLTGHISFNKGCYTGQEVVARLHYRGKSKRRMYLASLEAREPASAGTPLFSNGGEQSVGNVVNSADDNGQMLLVVATATGVENGLHLGHADGPLLTMAELPYALEPG